MGAIDDIAQEVLHRVALEGQAQGHQLVEHHSKAPDITLRVVLAIVADLWRHIVGSAYLRRSEILRFLKDSTHPKVP